MHSHDLTCQELVELVTDYLEGALSAEEQQRFDAHLSGCQGCRAHLEQMRQTIRISGSLTEESAPQKALDELLGHFRRWKQSG